MNFKFGLLGALALCVQVVQAQTTAFTYQGQLASGGAAVTGNFDLRFRLFDLATNLVAGPVTNAPVGVTNGLFLTAVDFGAAAFPGSARFLEIAVRTNGSTSAYSVLAPNQPLTSVPYAIQSLNASNAVSLSQPLPATNLSGTIPIAFLSTNVALLTSNQVFSGANTFRGVVTATNPANVFSGTLNGAFNGAAFGTFSGTGSNLTAIPATSLTGTLPDTNLSPNVPLLNINNSFSSNITAVQFTGSGHGLTNVPGAFFWLTVNGTTAQASSNLGFIVTNNTTAVTITLPASPSVGDTFKVAGVGAAGWILAQNSGQQILAGNLARSIGQNWVVRFTNGSGNNFTAVASSSDGTRLIAATSSATTGALGISSDFGAAWAATATTVVNPTRTVGPQYWSSVSSSADGSHLLATVGDTAGHSGLVYFSVNAGASWSVTNLSAPWIASACSADGTRMFVASYTGYIYYSTDAGVNWTQYYYNSAAAFTGLACSADGTKLVASSTGGNGGYLYVSGATNLSAGLKKWSAVASSADGSNLVATVTGGGIYTSSNGGTTWNQQNQANLVSWKSVASSSDGSRLAAAYNGPGYVTTSDNSGYTWTQSGATNAQWTAVASSADGSKLVIAASDGNLWTSAQGSTTTSGTTGYLVGGYLSALELQYVGNGLFLPLNHEGTIRAY